MKIDIIVPTNDIEEMNGFIESYKTLTQFREISQLVIIANGCIPVSRLNRKNFANTVIDVQKYYSGPVPFLKLRFLGMQISTADYFLFLDGDHRFGENSDDFLMSCVNEINQLKDCTVLCTDRVKNGKTGIHLKQDGFIWTNKGLFIKNVFSRMFFNYNMLGAGEDILLSYLAINKEGLPYIYYGSDITRKEKRHLEDRFIEDVSYTEEALDKGNIGYIKKLFNDIYWIHESRTHYVNYPNLLQKKINERINEKVMSKMWK